MPSTIRDFTELTTVAVDDYLLISDTSDVTNRDKRISVTNLQLPLPKLTGTPVAGRVASWLNATTLQDGGFALSDIARLSQTQTYTGAHTIQSPGASTVALTVDAGASGNTNAQVWLRGAQTVASLNAQAADHNLSLGAFDNGTSYGPYLTIGQNNNASTPSAGWIQMGIIGGTRRLWVDSAGNLRIHTQPPTNALDTAGTVVGAQTSTMAAKNILGDGIAPAAALNKLLETPVVEFEYKSGSYNHSRFHGIVADWSPEFSMDDGRVFSPVTAFGYSVQSTKALYQLIIELQAQVKAAQTELEKLRGE